MANPMIKLEAGGKAAVISYNVPEPTSYAGANVIELSFDDSWFTEAAKTIPANRRTSVSEAQVSKALDQAKRTGVIDTRVFPNAGFQGALARKVR